MSNEIDKIKSAIKVAFPDLAKVSFKRQGDKHYVTIQTDVLDPSKFCREFAIFLNGEAAKSGWSAGLTSSGLTRDGLRDATFRINYSKKF